MKLRQLTIIALSMLICAAPAVAGKSKKHSQKHPAPVQTAQPAPPPPAVLPDTMPSASLQQFLDAHLDRILAPLDAEGLEHPDLITDFSNSLADAGSKAAPTKRPA